MDRPEMTAGASPAKRARADAMESLDLSIHEFETLDPEALRLDIQNVGVVGVRLYNPNDKELLDYAEKIDSTARLVRSDGTAHGSRSMAGVTKRWGAPTHPNAWRVRLDPKVRRVFGLLYGTHELMVGCDAYTCLRGDAARACTKALPDDPGEKFHKITGSKLKPHIDVHPTMQDSPGRKVEKALERVSPEFTLATQGQLVLSSVPRGGATLVVAPGEHKHTDERHFECSTRRDFSVCTHAGYAHFDGKWRAVDAIDRGVLIIWASRLPHGNKLADPGVDPERLGLFIAWQPRALLPESERMQLKLQKWEAFSSGGSSDHWASFVPGAKGQGHRGGHYSNRGNLSTVLFHRDCTVQFSEDLSQRVWEAL